MSRCAKKFCSASAGDMFPIGPSKRRWIKPIDPAERRHFQILHVAPWTLAMGQFGFVETVYRLREGVVIGVSHAADRWLDASFGQTLGIANG